MPEYDQDLIILQLEKERQRYEKELREEKKRLLENKEQRDALAAVAGVKAIIFRTSLPAVMAACNKYAVDCAEGSFQDRAKDKWLRIAKIIKRTVEDIQREMQ